MRGIFMAICSISWVFGSCKETVAGVRGRLEMGDACGETSVDRRYAASFREATMRAGVIDGALPRGLSDADMAKTKKILGLSKRARK